MDDEKTMLCCTNLQSQVVKNLGHLGKVWRFQIGGSPNEKQAKKTWYRKSCEKRRLKEHTTKVFMQHVTLTHLSAWRWFHIQPWWGSVCGRQSLVVIICFMQLESTDHKGDRKTSGFLGGRSVTCWLRRLSSPDGHHSAPSRLQVFHIGGRYEGAPEWFQDFIWNYLSQNTCRTGNSQWRNSPQLSFQYSFHINVSLCLCSRFTYRSQVCHSQPPGWVEAERRWNWSSQRTTTTQRSTISCCTCFHLNYSVQRAGCSI